MARRALFLLFVLAALLVVPASMSRASEEEIPQKPDYGHVLAPAAPSRDDSDVANKIEWLSLVPHDHRPALDACDAGGAPRLYRLPLAAMRRSWAMRSWAFTDPAYIAARNEAHVLPRYPKSWNWPSSANPKESFTLLNKEAPEYIRFINPGDYRVAREACGACHMQIIEAAERSLMADRRDALGRRGL